MYSGEVIEIINHYRQVAERREQAAYERIRLQAFWALQPYSKKLTTPQKLVRFEWEKSQVAHVSTEDRLAVIERIRLRDQKIANKP